MTIISITEVFPSFHLIQSQSWRTEVWEEGYIEVPTNLVGLAYSSNGYCDLEIVDGVLANIIPRERPEPVPAEQRKRAYETEPLIDWDGDMITVDAANQLWLGYAAEENPKADDLQEKIIAAKTAIRTSIPG